MTTDEQVIETGRLRLEPLAARHLAAYTALTAQPAVHRYLSRAAEIAADPAGQAARIVGVAAEQWTSRGYGPFAIFETGGTKLIGRGGLFWVASLEAVEINYMFDPGAWGRGYATEVAAVFLDIGFRRHGLERMVATTNLANESSARVLAKVGMTRAGQKDLGNGRFVDFHLIVRDEWLNNPRVRAVV